MSKRRIDSNEGREARWRGRILGQKMVLRLYCQAPGSWHPTVEGGCYEIKEAAGWMRAMGPYVVKLAKVLKAGAPLVGPIAGLLAGPLYGMTAGALEEKLKNQIKLMEELAGKLKDDKEVGAGEWMEEFWEGRRMEQAEGAELRVLRAFLDEADKKHHWGGLKKVLTPEGHYLWLCGYHAGEYAS